MKKLQIDIVSDVMCPWCIVGYKGLENALQQLAPSLEADISWLPFELNPQMPIEGQDLTQHIMEKYGITKQQSDQNRDMLTQRGKDVEFDFNFSDQLRMINSFDLHRLLTWAKDQGKQHELQLALFSAHFTNNTPLNIKEKLLEIVKSVDLDVATAENILDSDQYSQRVRAEQKLSLDRGIHSVPTFIINNKYSVSGGQPAASFKKVLQEIAQEL
ncbi:DsbA family oxidoreductase [Psychrosphaera sp. B3R10]|uniref:DsbA family oxidoreductase n=1 Tax=unclassified Psychrosphaera TaxID=2641570 RepID=UPI001C08C57E|nr:MULTISPECIES: DsbA family oxidoreductase [unclassified Psychrosphaera]MBU2880697.1 DsbA family oxidoreductase [Psychrosphaera sp. I2R16]MBU2991557.1 DsbA family oxidoreductase [Psychrosphaera sp. B3R10]